MKVIVTVCVIISVCLLVVDSAFGTTCDDKYAEGHSEDGVYEIEIKGQPMNIFCQFRSARSEDTWMVFQRRVKGSVDFYRDWNSYLKGFGDLGGEFWLGLDKLHAITTSASYRLRVDLYDFDDSHAYAEYDFFKVGGENVTYALSIGGYHGNAGDCMSYHNDAPFSTWDKDHDTWSGNCAVARRGGFWYRACCYTNLNGQYFIDGQVNFKGVLWFKWKRRANSLMAVEMKMRPNYD